MIYVAISCAAAGALSCIVFALLCIRPALRVRGVIARVQSNPALLAPIDAQESSRSLAAATNTFDSAAQRLAAASFAIEDALASVSGFTTQVAVTATVVDSLLGLVVPRLRGMLAREE